MKHYAFPPLSLQCLCFILKTQSLSSHLFKLNHFKTTSLHNLTDKIEAFI